MLFFLPHYPFGLFVKSYKLCSLRSVVCFTNHFASLSSLLHKLLFGSAKTPIPEFLPLLKRQV